jgi:hypothetical protein
MTQGPERPQLLVPPARTDPIRVVPLHSVDELATPVHGAGPAPHPQLSYRGGPLMTAVEIFPVFWGSQWTTAPLNQLAGELNQFFDFIVTSALVDQLAEYSVPGKSIGHGKRVGSADITDPLHNSVSDSAIQHVLQHHIATDRAFPAAGPNTLYFLYLPPGVAAVQGGSRSCQAFCGYHSDIAGQIFYAVMPYPGCQGCTGSLGLLQALTSTSSHELAEAITDPIPGQGWYDDANGEIGDICAWKTKTLGGYTIQLEWSNKANACV